MGEISRALGQGSEFEFEGRKYVLSPWTFDIQGKFERYLEEQAFRVARRMAATMPQDEADRLLRGVAEDITTGKYTFGQKAWAEATTAIPHLQYLVFLMLQPHQPDVTLDGVKKIFEKDMELIYQKVAEVNADPSKAKTAEPVAPSP